MFQENFYDFVIDKRITLWAEPERPYHSKSPPRERVCVCVCVCVYIYIYIYIYILHTNTPIKTNNSTKIYSEILFNTEMNNHLNYTYNQSYSYAIQTHLHVRTNCLHILTYNILTLMYVCTFTHVHLNS